MAPSFQDQEPPGNPARFTFALIRDKERIGWQRAVGYGRRALGETAMFRYKALIGPGLRTRSLPAQKSEARASCVMLNRMTQLGMLISHRIV